LAHRLRSAGVDVVDLVGLGDGDLAAAGGVQLEQVYLPAGRRIDADVLVGLCGVAAPTGLLAGLGATLTCPAGGEGLVVTDLPATAAVVGSLAGVADAEAAVAGAEVAGRTLAGLALRRRPLGRVLPPSVPIGLVASPLLRHPRAGLLDGVIDLRVEQLDGFAASGSAALERLVAGSRRPGLSISARSFLVELSRTSPGNGPVADLVAAGTGPLPGPSLGALAELADLVGLPLRRSPLAEVHRSLGARLVEQDGWEDVWHYGDPEGEVEAGRSGAGLRDATAERWFRVAGTVAAAVVERATGFVPAGSDPGRVHPVGRDAVIEVSGGVWDVLAPIGRGGELHDRLLAAVAEYRPWEAMIVARNEDCARLRLIGPAANEVVDALGVDRRPGRSAVSTIAGAAVEVADRGSDGIELFVPAAAARAVWAALEAAGAPFGLRPVGLAAVEAVAGRRADQEAPA
jgi:sarcosine oxidase gamma subunit